MPFIPDSQFKQNGFTPDTQTGFVPDRRVAPSIFATPQPAPQTRNDRISQGVRKFTSAIFGGGKLAEGLGLSIAAPGVQKTLSTEQRETEALQNQLLERMRQNRAAGKDTTRLNEALRQSQGLASGLTQEQQDFASSLPTSKQVIGSAARLGASVLTGPVASRFSAVTGASQANRLLSGGVRGAVAGAGTGATLGAAHGAGIAAEANKSTEEIVLGGFLGGAGGAALGVPLGAISGAIAGRIRFASSRDKQFLEGLVSPKQTPKVREEAIRQGRFTDPTLFERATIVSNNRTQKLAESVKGVVDRKKTLSQNVDAIRTRVNEIDAGAGNYIENNNVPFNTAQLRSKLENGKSDLELIFASDASAEKTYNAVVNAFINNLGKKNTKGLFAGRKSFDQLPAIRKLLESDRLGENARKEIVLSVRRAANEYIASQLPIGNKYRAALRQEHLLLESLGNISEKGAAIIGKTRLQVLAQEYPMLKWFVSGLAGAGGIGVGSSIIGSLD